MLCIYDAGAGDDDDDDASGDADKDGTADGSKPGDDSTPSDGTTPSDASKAPPKPPGEVGEYDGETYKKDGQEWTGEEAKKMHEYDQKRYSDDPAERQAAGDLGKQMHEDKHGQQLRDNNEAARTRIPDKIGTMKD